MSSRSILPFVVCSVTLCITACGVTGPIQPTSSSKSGFEGAVFKGTTHKIHDTAPGAESYRVFVQGATGFVSMSVVREDAENRAKEFCKARGKMMDSLAETTADPPYILGNFPRIEIVFDCIDEPGAVGTASADPRYAKLFDLKKLLDTGAITQQEYNAEKAKILAQP